MELAGFQKANELCGKDVFYAFVDFRDCVEEPSGAMPMPDVFIVPADTVKRKLDTFPHGSPKPTDFWFNIIDNKSDITDKLRGLWAENGKWHEAWHFITARLGLNCSLCVEFWQPIRTEQDGTFKGKPADSHYVTKWVRDIALSLVVSNHACRVDLQFGGKEKAARRSEALKLFPTTNYGYKLPQTSAGIHFPVLDKGLNDREHWPEIREKLKSVGDDI